MAPTLVDDTQQQSDDFKYSFQFEIRELFQLGQDRVASYRWAQRLRFLVYDDSDDDASQNPSSNDDDDWPVYKLPDMGKTFTLPATKRPKRTIHSGDVGDSSDAAIENAVDSLADIHVTEDEDDQASTSDKDPNVYERWEDEDGNELMSRPEERECSFCLSQPRFPRNKKVKTFRLVQFKPTTISPDKSCSHFLAVSYCWPFDADGKPIHNTGTYRVRETNKNGDVDERKARAPDGILDKAVATCLDFGLRMIWIDQECIPQNDEVERAVGVQAIDLVYHQAALTIGILNSCRMTKDQQIALALVESWYNDDDFELPNITPWEIAEELLKFFSNFYVDRYHSRAWILQEMFTAADRGQLWISVEDGFFLPEEGEDGNDDDDDDKYGLPDSQISAAGGVCVLTSKMTELIHMTKIFFKHLIGKIGKSQQSDPSIMKTLFPMLAVIETIDNLYPARASNLHYSSRTIVLGHSNYGSRNVCNAAVALTYLKDRQNSHPVDRLAILANICDYQVRLDLITIENNFHSLTTCIVALTLMNGDLSLLVPEVYRTLKPPDQDLSMPSWLPPVHNLLPLIDSRTLRAGQMSSTRLRTDVMLAEPVGLIFPGYVWTVNRRIDMTPVMRAGISMWIDLLMVEEKGRQIRPDESDSVATSVGITATVSHSTPFSEYVERLLKDSPGMDLDVPALIEEAYVSAQEIAENNGLKTNLGKIFWHILSYLHNDLGETAVANSIWHSVRFDCMKPPGAELGNPKDDSERELPDDIGPILRHKDLFTPFWNALEFDDLGGASDRFSQMWIVDRIMKYSCLWVGQGHDLPDIPSEADVWDLTVSGNKDEGHTESENIDELRSKILQDQSTYGYLRQVVRSTFENTEGENWMMKEPSEKRKKRRWTVNNKSILSYYRDRWSVFDVEGPCLVFTPYDSDVERLPRPACRSWSWCWVVEKVPTEDLDFMTYRKSSGELRKLAEGDGKANTSEPDEDEWSDAVQYQTQEGKDKETEEETTEKEAVYRVINKVKGAWQHMPSTTPNYIFL